MSAIQYYVDAVMADRQREAQRARRPFVPRSKPRWPRRGALRRPRLHVRPA